MYVKPTDTNSYLKYDSAHPPKCKESLPYSQFIRIRRICKNKEDYDRNVEMKAKEFTIKGYPQNIIEKAKIEVAKKEREGLLVRKVKKESDTKDKIFLTTTYREGNQHVPKIVRKNWDILARSCTTKKIHRADLMMGYRKPRDLRSYLVKAKTDYNPIKDEIEKREGKCADLENRCDKKDCRYCTILCTDGQIE